VRSAAGDNYLAITTEAEGPDPASRAVAFAAKASAAVAALRDTRIRVGLAQGHVAVAPLQVALFEGALIVG
jgi:hypothetical protein